MEIGHQKDVLTTGEVARACHVAPRTVSKWFDTGRLKGYRIPGSRDRRIPMESLVSFMRAHEMPLGDLDGGVCRILIINGNVPADLLAACSKSDRHDVRTAGNGFEAGMVAQQFRPHAVVVDADDDDALQICGNIKSNASFGSAAVIGAAKDVTDSLREHLASQGFDAVLPSPYSFSQLCSAVQGATELIR